MWASMKFLPSFVSLRLQCSPRLRLGKQNSLFPLWPVIRLVFRVKTPSSNSSGVYSVNNWHSLHVFPRLSPAIRFPPFVHVTWLHVSTRLVLKTTGNIICGNPCCGSDKNLRGLGLGEFSLPEMVKFFCGFHVT